MSRAFQRGLAFSRVKWHHAVMLTSNDKGTRSVKGASPVHRAPGELQVNYTVQSSREPAPSHGSEQQLKLGEKSSLFSTTRNSITSRGCHADAPSPGGTEACVAVTLSPHGEGGTTGLPPSHVPPACSRDFPTCHGRASRVLSPTFRLQKGPLRYNTLVRHMVLDPHRLGFVPTSTVTLISPVTLGSHLPPLCLS